MAWVTFEGKLYCLPTHKNLTATEFRALQKTNRDRHVLIFAPEGGHESVSMLQLKHAELDSYRPGEVIEDVALDLGPFALDLEISILIETAVAC